MSRPVAASTPRRAVPTRRGGYTLVEILTATALTLVMMTAVVAVLGTVSESISKSRAGLEMMDRLRAAQRTLRHDLGNLTVTMLPPRRPESNEGYFEYIEGPLGPVDAAHEFFYNTEAGDRDSTVRDLDDILMFTVRSPGVPFVGRYGSEALESHVAEIAWFVRGRTLYRRVLLVAPQILNDTTVNPDGDGKVEPGELGGSSFFELYDISARPEDYTLGETSWAPNSLADLTKRENRFAHRVHATTNDPFPYNASRWGQLGLPTLEECSHEDWMDWTNTGTDLPPSVIAKTASDDWDLWFTPHPWSGVDAATGILDDYTSDPRVRVGEDVILTNVIGFDVKVWDPGAPTLESGGVALVPGDPGYSSALGSPSPSVISYGAYADLGWGPGYSNPSGAPEAVFNLGGKSKSKLNYPASSSKFTYDTWSFHYEHDGEDQDGQDGDDQGTNGFDDDGDGVVDDVGELETRPPYPHPLRGIQVKIRVFEPDGRQVREVTVIQDFLPK